MIRFIKALFYMSGETCSHCGGNRVNYDVRGGEYYCLDCGSTWYC